jgi:hypothetical protein
MLDKSMFHLIPTSMLLSCTPPTMADKENNYTVKPTVN